MENKIAIYTTADNNTEISVQFDEDTVWLTQLQLSELFGKNVRTINEHILNIYKTGELGEEATIRKSRIVRMEGARKVQRSIEHYNLDMIISVGYRVNSKRGIQFRQWATVDGNKRIAAACFVYFLQQNSALLKEDGKPVIDNDTLAALTLFIAVSKPDEADTVKKLIISILNRSKV